MEASLSLQRDFYAERGLMRTNVKFSFISERGECGAEKARGRGICTNFINALRHSHSQRGRFSPEKPREFHAGKSFPRSLLAWTFMVKE